MLELHESSDVQAYLADMLIHFKTNLESVPGKLAISIAEEKDTNKIMDVLDRGIADDLEELSKLASIPARYRFFDEIDKMPAFSLY